MSEKTKESLSVFMKKQISEKSSKKTAPKKSVISSVKNLDQGEDKENNCLDNQDEMTDEEKLAEAKKASRNKAAGFDQTEMFKKLFLENLAKYTLLFAILVIVTIGVITLGPAMVKFFNKLIYNLFLGSLPS